MSNYLAIEKNPIEVEVSATEFLHQLLPYDPTTRTAKALFFGLKDYQLLLKAALEAIQHFEKGDLIKFDSLVGENACQIRAVMLAQIASQKKVDSYRFRQRVNEVLEAIQEYLESKKIAAYMLSGVSLSEIIQSGNLTVDLTAEENFLIQSFLLTETKVDPDYSGSLMTPREVTCSTKLKKFGDVSTNFTQNLVSKLRALLSFASVHFVRKATEFSHYKLLKKMVSEDFTKQHIGCYCIPMFWVYISLLNLMKKEEIPVVIHAKIFKKEVEGKYSFTKELCLYYGHERNGQLIEMPLSRIVEDKPVIVFQGIVLNDAITEEEWKMMMKSYSICDIILAAAADHRQYPNPELDHLIDIQLDKEYRYYKNLAEQNGFSLKNPTRFLIQHVFASYPKDISPVSRI